MASNYWNNDNRKQSNSLRSSDHYPYNQYHHRQVSNRKSSLRTSRIHVLTNTKNSAKGYPNDFEEEEKRRRRRRCCGGYCWLCSVPCALLSLLLGFLLAAGLACLIFFLIISSSRTTSTSTSTTTSTSSTSTSTTTSTSSTSTSATTSTSSTSTSTTTSTTSTSTSSTTSTTTMLTPNGCTCLCANGTRIFNSDAVAKWSFDETYADKMNNYNAAPLNDPLFAKNGYVNQAVLFNASLNQSLTAPHIPLAYSSFTVEVWLKLTGFPNPVDYSILGVCPVVYVDYECLHLVIRGPNHLPYMGFFGKDCAGNTSITLNEWTHVAFVFDNNTSTQTIYVNGILDNYCSGRSSITPTTGDVTIGGIPILLPLKGPNYFEGYLDQLVITTRAKSACEILEDATLVACFSFDASAPYADSGPNSLLSSSFSTSIIPRGGSDEAISFNGAAYFQISSFTALGLSTQPYSIVFWILPRTQNRTVVLVSDESDGMGWCAGLMGITSSGTLGGQVFDNGQITISGSAISMSPVWTHVVETWSPTNGLRLYQNGVLVSSNPSATTYTASGVSNFITLGNCLNGTNVCTGAESGFTATEPFNGDVDDFRVYSRELIVTEINKIYNS